MTTNIGVLSAYFCWYKTPAEEQGAADVTRPPDEPELCDPCPPSQGPRRGATRWLHAVFHPGCVDGECAATGVARDRSRSPSSCAEAQQRPATSASMTHSLNVYGALLHLGTDVLRNVIVFITGVMIATGVLADGAKADAV